MAVHYRVFRNDGAGGPVAYDAPMAVVEETSLALGPLAAPGDHTFAVRAFDPATGMAEANTDARVRILLDAEGREIAARPNAPHALTVRPSAGGGCRVAWAYSPLGQAAAPVGFHVYRGAGSTPDYTSPAATVPYRAGMPAYAALLDGLADGVSHAVAVRAFNDAGDEGNTLSASVVVHSRPPDDVESLAAVAVLDR